MIDNHINFDELNTCEGRTAYLVFLRDKLIERNNWQRLVISRKWAQSFKKVPGVYAIRNESEIIYVGETGSLRGRMLDLLDSRNHTIRRNIGKKYFSDHEKYTVASSSVKYDDEVDSLISAYMNENLFIACMEVRLGRKELEDFILQSINIEVRLNIRLGRT